MEDLKEGVAFIIATDSYAGNFEREMCAHVTGQIGECEVGEEYVDGSISLIFDENIQQVADDNGTYRPVSVGGNKAQSVCIFFYEKPTEEQIILMKERAKTFAETKRNISNHSWDTEFQLEILGFSIAHKGVSITEESV